MINALTSFRFIFALMIFLHHFTIGNSVLFPEGFLGVSFFFILSGFVLTYTYKDKIINKSISSRSFMIRRISKIYPLHLLLLAFAFLMYFGNYSISQTLSNLFLIQSWIPLKSYYFSLNAVSWCLSNEVFFYLMFPFLILMCYRISNKWVLTSSVFIILFYLLLIQIVPAEYDHFLFYIFPISRLLDFMLGILLCDLFLYIKRKRIVNYNKLNANLFELSSLLLLVIFILISSFIPKVYRYAIYYWVPMSVLILTFAYFNESKGLLSKILSSRFLVLLGEASFCFYMIHQLSINIMKAILCKLEIQMEWQYSFIIILSCVIAASIICYVYFEKPVNKYIRLKNK